MEISEGEMKMNGGDEWRYLIVRPERAGIGDLWRFWRKADVESGAKFIDRSSSSSDDDDDHGDDDDDDDDDDDGFGRREKRWLIVVSVIMRKVLGLLNKPMEWTGLLVEFLLNLLSLNGYFLGLLFNLLQGKLVIPKRGTTNFISSIGFLDDRVNLHNIDNFEAKLSMGNRSLMDLCIMASKLAYENASLVEHVIVNLWKMHFVGFYNGWNDYQKEMSTQVFILCEKPTDANLILISFRGTELFDAYDWSTDFDYSWYEIPNLGRVHVGFLEALGLGNRNNTTSFQYNLQSANDSNFYSSDDSNDKLITAYDAVITKLKELLAENRDAKFVITGHSLGGALAILLPIVLVLNEESEVMERLLGVYTFGQPRVGDEKLGRFMEEQLNKHEVKYCRVVYCNDLVPRLPYDDKMFLYKHFGSCLYYDSFYTEKKVDEEPNRNYFGLRYLIPEYLNAVWELIRALTIQYLHGSDYKENWCSILVRFVGLMMPGISAHSPRDYINSVRLGRGRAVHMSSLE